MDNSRQIAIELAQFRSHFLSQVRSLRPKMYALSDSMDESVIRLEAWRVMAYAAGHDWLPEVVERSAEYCGVDTRDAATLIKRLAIRLAVAGAR